MCAKVLLLLLGAVCIYYQVKGLSAADMYVAELMVESNITLEAKTILTVMNETTGLTVTVAGNVSHMVTLLSSELIAECTIIGNNFYCNCSPGYTWSNEVCYSYSCCNASVCTGNVSDITPLCVAEVEVFINGSVILKKGTWMSNLTDVLETNFQNLNSFKYLNVTGQRLGDTVADFEVSVSTIFPTSKLQDILAHLETSLGATLLVDTAGLVTIESPEGSVCYGSEPVLKCLFEESMASGGWNMSRKYERFELNNGSVVKLDHSCSTEKYKSCVSVRLQKVTGIWSGLYECGFTNGSIRHTAKAQLRVTLLPDAITVKINPLSVDCSEKMSTDSIPVIVTATIASSRESFEVWWSYMGEKKSNLANKTDGDYLVYNFTAPISCQETPDAQYINVTFKNMKKQIKSARVDIPVIYEGKTFCEEEYVNGEFWPKTPSGDTLINQTCVEGREGYKSRTCEDSVWQMVFSYCVNKELLKVLNAADNFVKGLGATHEVAMDIFSGLKNTSMSNASDGGESMADVKASVNVLTVMASASGNIALQEEVFPDFVNAASNLLNGTWDGVNDSTVHDMSSNYLQSVEGLVKNINVNRSNGLSSQNLELKFCSHSDCDVSVFDIGVNMNMSARMLKTVAVKNLMDKLKNNYKETLVTGLLLSATLVDNNNPSLDIRLEFPQQQLKPTKPTCVFWNTSAREWSDVGCSTKSSTSNRTICECNHLTSFSVLMAKSDVSNGILDVITSVGLGVSIFCLLIFLFIESLVWSAVVKTNLSHFRHTAIVNIAMFLLLADCCFLASTSPKDISNTWCLVLTVCKHLFFLVMFSWMLCMSVMLVHQLIFVFSPLRKRVFMFFSSIIGYICPILIVGSSYVYCKYTNKLYYNKDTCWLVYDSLLEGSLHAFILPVGTITLTNLFSMVVVMLTLVKSSVPEGSKAADKETAKGIIKVVVVLTPVFGVTWIIGFGLLLLDKDTPLFNVANYSFTILNSFQGLFILIVGCFAEQKVRTELLKLIREKSKGKSESMKNLNSTSTMYTRDK